MQLRLKRLVAQGSVVALTVMALGLAACGSSNAASGGTLIIASELPTSGADQAVGTATQDGVELAVDQAVAAGTLTGGYKLQFKSYNDASVALGKHDPAQGQKNVQDIVSNPEIMGFVGAFNSGVSAVEIPVVNQSDGPVMISPANTNPGLTLQQYAQANGFNYDTLHPSNHKDFYFRIPANDVVQGGLDAKIALTATPIKPALKTAFVLDDGEVYGQGLAKFFSTSFVAGGGTLVGSETTISTSQTASFPALATSIVSLKPDVIFFGGTTGAGAGALKQAIAAAGGASILWDVGDGVDDNSDWQTEAGQAAAGIFGTVAAPELSQLSTAASFVTAFKAKYGIDAYPYSAIAYDAANIEITAIENVIKSGQKPTRANVRDQVASIKYTGIVGNISFDQYGDNSGTKYFSVWAITDPTNPVWVIEQNVDASTLGS